MWSHISTHFLGQRCVCTGSTCNGRDVQHGQRQVLRRREACTLKHECMYACAHTQTACIYTHMHSPRRPTLLLPTLSVGQRTCTTWLDQEPSGPGMVKKSLFSGNGRRTTNSNAGDPASVLASTIPASKWGPWNFSRSHPFEGVSRKASRSTSRGTRAACYPRGSENSSSKIRSKIQI